MSICAVPKVVWEQAIYTVNESGIFQQVCVLVHVENPTATHDLVSDIHLHAVSVNSRNCRYVCTNVADLGFRWGGGGGWLLK